MIKSLFQVSGVLNIVSPYTGFYLISFNMVKKALFIFLLTFLASKLSYSQQADTTYQVYEDSLNGKYQKKGSYEKVIAKKKPSISGLRFSLGGGITTILHSDDIWPLVTANVNFRLYESLFLTVGYDLFEVRDSKSANVLYFAPNLNTNFLKDIFSFFGGIGFYVVAPVKAGINPPGIVFLARVEGNISKTFSIGTEIKHVRIIEESKTILYTFSLYTSVKLY